MDTFCVLPWHGKEVAFNRPKDRQTRCCLLPAEYDIEHIKHQMLQGKRPTECQKCWNLEDKNIKSDRQVKNETLDFYLDKDISLIYQEAQAGNTDTLILKLITSYTCNGTCIICDELSSSSWYQLKKKNVIPVINDIGYRSIDFDNLYSDIDCKKLAMLSLVGGEPLYEKKNFEFLQHLLDVGNDKVFVSIVTNGSVNLTKKQKNILSRFKNLNFSISIDGTEQVFEYTRYPLKWNTLLDNLKFFREITNNISSNYTISNVNILYHNDITVWFNDQKIPYSKSQVYNPAYFQPRALPLNVKDYLRTKLTTSDYAAFIGNAHTEKDQALFEQAIKEIQLQDRVKNISIKNYLPELATLINLL